MDTKRINEAKSFDEVDRNETITLEAKIAIAQKAAGEGEDVVVKAGRRTIIARGR